MAKFNTSHSVSETFQPFVLGAEPSNQHTFERAFRQMAMPLDVLTRSVENIADIDRLVTYRSLAYNGASMLTSKRP
jgi:hypothetical protein